MPALGLLGGYYLDFERARALMRFYEIPDKGVQDRHLYYPLNDWLAKYRKYTVLAGAIRHPSKGSSVVDGMMLVTQQVWYQDITKKTAESLPPRAERDIDVRVKQWLISGGAAEDRIEWVNVWDTTRGITRYGRRPTRNDVQGQRPRLRLDTTKLSDQDKHMVPAWVERGMPDARTFFGEELYEVMTAD